MGNLGGSLSGPKRRGGHAGVPAKRAEPTSPPKPPGRGVKAPLLLPAAPIRWSGARHLQQLVTAGREQVKFRCPATPGLPHPPPWSRRGGGDLGSPLVSSSPHKGRRGGSEGIPTTRRLRCRDRAPAGVVQGGGPGTAVVCIDPETSTAGGRADQRRWWRRRQRDRPPVGAGVTLPPASAAVLRLAGACAQPAATAGELGPVRRQQVSRHKGAGSTGRAGGCAAAASVPERGGGRGRRREP